jgi:hypothetical protein
MRTWPALLVAPLLALADQGIAYALAGWGCATQRLLALHAVHAVFLVVTLVLTAIAWRGARHALRQLRADAGFSVQRKDFVGVMAVAIGALSAVMIVAMWIPQWFLSPCYA